VDIVAADAGNYWVRVRNAYGFVESQPATLSIAVGQLLLNDMFSDGRVSNQSLPGSAAWISSSSAHSIVDGGGSGSLIFRKRLPRSYATALMTSLTNASVTPSVPVYQELGASPVTTQSFEVGVDYTVTFVATRKTADSMHLAFVITGGSLLNYAFEVEDTEAINVAFDCLGVASTSTNGSDFTVDNVTVESVDLSAFQPIDLWRQTRFGAASNRFYASDAADPDADGFSNLLEYALGLDPLVNDRQSAQLFADRIEIEGIVYASLCFTKDPAATDVAIYVASSSDMTTWNELDTDGSNQLVLEVQDTLQRLVIKDPIPLTPANGARFFQLRAVLIP
jgi:hypothetical protein